MTVTEAFRKHVDSVDRLMNFDRDVLEFAIQAIGDLQTRLVQHHELQNPHLTAGRTLEILKGYRAHDSLRPRYKTIFNQALVLLVSYFGASVHDVFRKGIAAELQRDSDSTLLREQFRLSFRDLKDYDFQLRDVAPDLLVQAKDISFQDMQSIYRAFKEYLDIRIERDQTVNEIIVAQGCRHVIVHAGGAVSDRLLRQISGATPRTLKRDLIAGDLVEFSVDEVSSVANSMISYLERLEAQVETKIAHG